MNFAFSPLGLGQEHADASNTCRVEVPESDVDSEQAGLSDENSSGRNFTVPQVSLPPQSVPNPPPPSPPLRGPVRPAEWTASVEENFRGLIRNALAFEVNGSRQGMVINARLQGQGVILRFTPRHRVRYGSPYAISVGSGFGMRLAMARGRFLIEDIWGISLLVKFPGIPDEIRVQNISVDFVNEMARVRGVALWGRVHIEVRADLRRRELRGVDWHFGGGSPAQTLATTFMLLSSMQFSLVRNANALR